MAVDSVPGEQRPSGADAITRISAAMMDPVALDKLAAIAYEQGSFAPYEVYEMVLADNATVAHLALSVAPFIMSTRPYSEVLPTDLGITADRAVAC